MRSYDVLLTLWNLQNANKRPSPGRVSSSPEIIQYESGCNSLYNGLSHASFTSWTLGHYKSPFLFVYYLTDTSWNLFYNKLAYVVHNPIAHQIKAIVLQHERLCHPPFVHDRGKSHTTRVGLISGRRLSITDFLQPPPYRLFSIGNHRAFL